MSKIEEDLQKEIDTWLPRAEEAFGAIKECNDEDFRKNIEAYISDTYYFLEKKDLIKAFEAIVWAWSWIEIGKLKGMLK